MTTKAQKIVFESMSDEGKVFVEPLEIDGRVYATVRACVTNHRGKRLGPWWLIAEDGATMSLPEPCGEQIIEACRIHNNRNDCCDRYNDEQSSNNDIIVAARKVINAVDNAYSERWRNWSNDPDTAIYLQDFGRALYNLDRLINNT